LEPEVSFFFYLGAVICFALAAIGENWRYGARTRRGQQPTLTLLPLGLALAVVPTLWNTGELAF
jgi:hypothetical protein